MSFLWLLKIAKARVFEHIEAKNGDGEFEKKVRLV